MRPSEGYATSHRLKWGPSPPEEVCKIVQYVMKEEEQVIPKKRPLTSPVHTQKYNMFIKMDKTRG